MTVAPRRGSRCAVAGRGGRRPARPPRPARPAGAPRLREPGDDRPAVRDGPGARDHSADHDQVCLARDAARLAGGTTCGSAVPGPRTHWSWPGRSRTASVDLGEPVVQVGEPGPDPLPTGAQPFAEPVVQVVGSRGAVRPDAGLHRPRARLLDVGDRRPPGVAVGPLEGRHPVSRQAEDQVTLPGERLADRGPEAWSVRRHEAVVVLRARQLLHPAGRAQRQVDAALLRSHQVRGAAEAEGLDQVPRARARVTSPGSDRSRRTRTAGSAAASNCAGTAPETSYDVRHGRAADRGEQVLLHPPRQRLGARSRRPSWEARLSAGRPPRRGAVRAPADG